ncbi:MAG: HAMP domain-containing histidine kinase [Clostridia bacterium]|nr:HAMP domain-containing histidine kinase [Clostridia bacterium]
MLKDEFVSSFTHELKTPVNSILGFARLIKSSNCTEKEKDEYIEIIISEAERLSRLSESILLLTRLERSTELNRVQRFNVSEQLRRVVVLLQSAWQEKKLEIDFDSEEIFIYGNPDLLEQAWINLVGNAIKFSPAGGKVYIRAQQTQDTVVISFSDQGKGMDDDTVKHAFECFYQGDSEYKSKGNGIGLSLVKKICELHGGSVSITKTDEKGTTFTVKLKITN